MRSKLANRAHLAVLTGCSFAPGSSAAAAESVNAGGGSPGVWFAGAVAVIAVAAAFHYRRRLGRLEAERTRLAGVARRDRDVLAHAPDQFLCWDLAGGGEESSPGLAALIGKRAEDRIPFAELSGQFAAGDRATLESAVERLHASGEEFELTLVTSDGRRTLRFNGSAVAGADGALTLAILWMRDETRAATSAQRLDRQVTGLKRLLDLLPLPVWSRGADLTLEYANSAYATAVDRKPGDSPDSLPELSGNTEQSLARRTHDAEQGLSEEHHVVMAGARRLVRIHESRLPGEDRIGGYATDLTEIEEVRAELTRHVAGHEEVLHKLGTAVAIYDADQRLKFFNNAFLRLWQLDEIWLRTEPSMGEVLESLRDSRRLPETANFPEFKSEQLRQFTSLIDPYEELIYLPDGATFRSMVTPHPFGGLLLTWEDVSDTLALERSYNTLIAVQRETLDNLYEGVAVIGGDGRLQLSNPAFGKMWQMSDEERSALPHISDVVERMRDFVEQDDDWQTQRDEVIALLTDREGHTGRLERSDGSVLDYATVPLPDGAVLLSCLDVSDSTRVERALRERNDALETADRLKSEFIANVSYELRTPLNTIIGFTEILTGQYFGPLNDRQTEYSRGILESSQRLSSLINDILDLASIESGHLILDLEPVNLHDMLSSVLTLTRERMRKKRLALEFDCPLDIGTIMADERRLKQALFNILVNSVKFTPEGGSITVSARRIEDQVTLTVTDTGIGISQSEQLRVFQRFERGTSSDARQAGAGAGLGLSLVKSFIELHGGVVELESEPGVGTKVTCILPAREVDDVGELRTQTG